MVEVSFLDHVEYTEYDCTDEDFCNNMGPYRITVRGTVRVDNKDFIVVEIVTDVSLDNNERRETSRYADAYLVMKGPHTNIRELTYVDDRT